MVVCQNRYLFLEPNSIAVHPTNDVSVLRWTDPLNGECTVDLAAIASERVVGVRLRNQNAFYTGSSGNTRSRLHLLHNHNILSTTEVTDYALEHPLSQTITVTGGDIIDIVVSKVDGTCDDGISTDQTTCETVGGVWTTVFTPGATWTGLSGGLDCTWD